MLRALSHAGHDAKLTGRHFAPGEGPAPFRSTDGGKIVGGACVQKRILGESARSYQALDRARDNRFCAPLLGLRRVLCLFTDGDPEASVDELFKIAVGAPYRDTTHRYILAGMLAALGQRNIKCGSGLDRIVEEEFVEVAHAVKE